MAYTWGKDIAFKWYPLIDNVQVQDFPSQSPTIYVFHDEARPSLAAARAGTGASATISTWTAIPGGFQFTISAINDPDVNAETQTRTYWIAINFILKTAGQTQCVIEPIELGRVMGQQFKIELKPANILASYPEISDYATNSTIDEAILDAIVEIRTELEEKGFEWAQIKRPDKLYVAAKYKTLMIIEGNQRQQSGDKFDIDFNTHEEKYKSIMGGLKLEYDSNLDNHADSTEKAEPAGTFSMAIR